MSNFENHKRGSLIEAGSHNEALQNIARDAYSNNNGYVQFGHRIETNAAADKTLQPVTIVDGVKRIYGAVTRKDHSNADGQGIHGENASGQGGYESHINGAHRAPKLEAGTYQNPHSKFHGNAESGWGGFQSHFNGQHTNVRTNAGEQIAPASNLPRVGGFHSHMHRQGDNQQQQQYSQTLPKAGFGNW